MLSLVQRFQGALMGLTVGDALGAWARGAIGPLD